MDIVIIGCGIIGATLAYELSLVKGLNITVIDKQPPAQASTGAALGVLMGAISKKVKGNAWRLRETSINRYQSLIPEVEEIIGRRIPVNYQGILSLQFSEDDLSEWLDLAKIRESQGWNLEIWDRDKLREACPQVENSQIIGAVYSPDDRQINPTELTLALVDAGKKNGVTFKFGINVAIDSDFQTKNYIETTEGKIFADYFIISAGCGSTLLTKSSIEPVDIRPVLGQAIHLHLPQSIGNSDFQPVITGQDVHIVPVISSEWGSKSGSKSVIKSVTEYWIGATVEFPLESSSYEDEIIAKEELLENLIQQAISFSPQLGQGKIVRKWIGLRPRPQGRPAPVIGKLPGFDNILLATGHYRNGVLLAPATARAIREMLGR
jgi:glycine/D-amino acid oxidase-like deaminating enzyme